ncbi:OsmC family protein [Herpetosiphon sp. NSE202]|uniref:OsmC family protein n=1 Tax=Herpetosiphon sp. NSE202 TaxID=3351349 RepID=UPI003627B93A
MAGYTVNIEWERKAASFSDGKDSRAHRWIFDGGQVVPGSSSPHVVPLPYSDEQAVDPEEAFVAALSSCHMLWFLSIVAEAGFVVDHYADQALGKMGKNSAGKIVMSKVTLRPSITWVEPAPSAEQIEYFHHQAHDKCFLANSVYTEISIEPQA